MNPNSQAIIIFCSHMCVPEGVKPLEPHEWTALAEKLLAVGLAPKDILNFSTRELVSELELDRVFAQRLTRLTGRSAALFSAVSTCLNSGINIYTRADREYPAKLKRKLGMKCPPLFYCAGDITIAELPAAGYAGSRHISDDDEKFTRDTVRKTCAHRLGVVSGGAKGVDSAAAQTALTEGWPVIEYIAGGLLSILAKKDIRASVSEGKRLILSEAVPNAGFSVGWAMSRNQYIYAQSEAAVIIRSDLKKGGTWHGADENLRHKWCPMFCRNADYPGNIALIAKGAIPINEDWDGDIKRTGNTGGQIEIPYPQ